MPKNIARVTVDGQDVYYRPEEVIAIGVAAARFARRQSGARLVATLRRHHPSASSALRGAHTALTDAIDSEALDETKDRVRSALEKLERANAVLDEEIDDGTRLVSSLPPAFRFDGLDDAEAVVADARSRGLRVQLNHVFFSHGGCACGCDPCCAANPYGAFPYKATPYKATPYKATPYKATAPARTNAESTPAPAHALERARELAAAAESGAAEASELPNVNVWILDTGSARESVVTPLDGLLEGEKEDYPDQSPETPDRLVDPVAGHGTFIAGIITQLAPGCNIWISHVIQPTGDLEEWDVADKIHELLNAPPTGHEDLSRTILNLSFGGGLASACNPLVGEAIAAAQEAGVVVVASAGNDASCIPVYPGNFPGVTAVGALDHDGDPAHFTNRGSWVDACALGVDIVSAFFAFNDEDIATPAFPDGWAVWSGTSFATPVVVAAIAGRMGGNTSAADARDALLADGTAVPCLGVRVDGGGFSDSLQLAES